MSGRLSLRARNRALLARQSLLERRPEAAETMVENLVGMQAQNPTDPYFGLWARLDGFEPAELENLLSSRGLVRCWPLRRTVHLVTAADAGLLLPLAQEVAERTMRGAAAKNLGGADLTRLKAQARELVEAEPRIRPELVAPLAATWPEAHRQSLGYAATMLVPMVQLPPRGLWHETGPAVLTTADAWLGAERGAESVSAAEPSRDAALETVVLRYLAAFGPASNADLRTWSGLTGVHEVTKRLGSQLTSFTDEDGRRLFDVADAPRPDPDTPAPPRFLPEFDNVFLSHDARDHIVAPEVGWIGRITVERAMRKLLVDGFVAGEWAVDPPVPVTTLRPDDSSGVGQTVTLTIRPYRALRGAEEEQVTAEGARLLASVAPGGGHDIKITAPAPPERARHWNPQ